MPFLSFFRRKRAKEATKNKYRIPNERRISMENVGAKWDLTKMVATPLQRIVPKSEELNKVLKELKGKKVFVFAAYTGEWAKALADLGAKVHYSDLSPSALKEATKRHKGAFDKAFVVDAAFYPIKPNEYDWSFSFEPYPLHSSTLILSALRGLINRQGLLLVYYTEAKDAEEILGRITSTYNARLVIREEEITDISGFGGIEEQKVRIKIYKLLTNKRAKKMALQDIRVLEAIRALRAQKRIPKTRPFIKEEGIGIEEIKELLKKKGILITEKEIINSLQRLEKLSEYTVSFEMKLRRKNN